MLKSYSLIEVALAIGYNNEKVTFYVFILFSTNL